MPKTIQIRDLDDEVYAALAARATRQNISVPELIRRELSTMAARPTTIEWLESLRRPIVPSEIDSVAAIHEMREEWLNARS